MIELTIHVPSIFIGFFIGYVVVATVMICVTSKDRGDFAAGWDRGCEYGRNDERAKIEREKQKDGQTDLCGCAERRN